jgi:hypothetical protein
VKKVLLGIVLGLVIAGVAAYMQNRLRIAILKPKNMRYVWDANAIAAALEQYKTTHGAYPAAMDASGLELALVPGHLRSLPKWGLRYFSDGSSYTLFVRLGGEGPISLQALGDIEIRDGKWVSWPDLFTEQELRHLLDERRQQKTSTAQPNYRLQATVGGLGVAGPARWAFAPRA